MEQNENLKILINDSVNEFRARSSKLQSHAQLLLFLIFCTLVAGILVFIFASEITKNDIGDDVSDDDKIKNYIAIENSYKSQIDSLESLIEQNFRDEDDIFLKIRAEYLFELDSLSNIAETLVFSRLANSGLSYNPDDIEKNEMDLTPVAEPIIKLGKRQLKFKSYLQTRKFSKELISAHPNLENVERRYTELVNRIDTLVQNEINKIKSDEANYAKAIDSIEFKQHLISLTLKLLFEKKGRIDAGLTNSDSLEETSVPRLIQTNITRFGSILMILFFVKIIIPQYRYSLRLASYYDARADALLLFSSGFKDLDFDLLVSTLTPTYDFGNGPDSPYEKVIELLNLSKNQTKI